jgi:hypothetical protein
MSLSSQNPKLEFRSPLTLKASTFGFPLSSQQYHLNYYRNLEAGKSLLFLHMFSIHMPRGKNNYCCCSPGMRPTD